ncbi:MAG: Rrf2 family transcriptional regulator [Selenomonas sp.]|uniref:Rrf2 family transcriptional regulator n=1 Tax=Selenomonas sp. TaxID=2053611 RepID=UPI0025D8395F|nr:Rrf2 family transcriptional regulator [Selenomonas sp.]MCR5757140.1 Rrf2 family transcriptional regulator [Selenomonas sp.]
MKYSSKLSDAMHILAFIQIQREHPDNTLPPRLTSQAIATSLHTNPSFVRQIMMKLRSAGLLLSEQGTANPRLGRPASEISLCDVYRAVEGNKPLLHLDKHINEQCDVGVHIQLALQDYYDEIQHIAEAKMKSIFLSDVIQSYYKRVPSQSLPI